RMYKKKGLSNPVENFRALRRYHDDSSGKVDLIIWYRNLALVAIGFYIMPRPGELCELRLKDIEKKLELCG
ncbi:33651_t:CDS:2, partial [Racocetra persica]